MVLSPAVYCLVTKKCTVPGDGQLVARDGTELVGACNLSLASYNIGHQTGSKDPSNYTERWIEKGSPTPLGLWCLADSPGSSSIAGLLGAGRYGTGMDSSSEISEYDHLSPELSSGASGIMTSADC